MISKEIRFLKTLYFSIYLHVNTLLGPHLISLPLAGRTCSTLFFSDFVEEKT
jgi:hypothetical protein